jgi:hypothetical protein
MTTYFHELGSRIQADWRRRDVRESDFPDVCLEALSDLPPKSHVGIDDVVSMGFSSERLVPQADVESEFGQPPITVFTDSRFSISVLFWLDGTTAIHEHGFGGAFHVLHGGSLQTTFSFEESRSINEHMKLGSLHELETEVLAEGATRAIRSSGATIHSLFHLDQPSATVVVRTHTASMWRPQYRYFRPGLALNERYDRDELRRRREMMTLVHRTSPRSLEPLLVGWVAQTDFVSAFVGVSHALVLLTPEEGDGLLDRMEKQYPQLVEVARATTENERREQFIIRRRASATEPELRFFLAILLNVKGRERAMRIVRDRFRDRDPIETTLSWIRALGRAEASEEGDESALGFHVDDLTIDVLRELLRGSGDATLARVVGRAHRLSECDLGLLGELSSALRNSEVFRYLLADG